MQRPAEVDMHDIPQPGKCNAIPTKHEINSSFLLYLPLVPDLALDPLILSAPYFPPSLLNMVLRVAPLLESDVAAFAAVDDAATRGWPLAMAMETSNRVAGETRQEMITGWMEKGFANPDPKVHWLKAVDDDLNGELVAAGCWKFETAPSANEEQSPVAAEVPAPSEMKGPEEPKELTGPATTGVFAGMAKGWEEFKKDFFANIDYASMTCSPMLASVSQRKR